MSSVKYFLFGKEACALYQEGGIDALEDLKSGDCNIFEWNQEKSQPFQILDQFKGFESWSYITSSDFHQLEDQLNHVFNLEKGMIIRAKKDLKGCTNSFNTPETVFIEKGTTLKIPEYGTRMGDVFTTLIDGVATYVSRSPSNKGGHIEATTVGLQEGHESNYPQDLGQADIDSWEVVH